MRRPELEHVLRAASAITGCDEFIIIGSQSVLGSFPSPPEELTVSQELDLFSFKSETVAELVDGSIGEGSLFHSTFGYYAHGVGADTAVLPEDWRSRLVRVHTPRTGGATGLCLEVHDLAVSKLVAGREKDLVFVAGLLRHKLVRSEVIRDRLGNTRLDDQRRALTVARFDRIATEAR